MVARLVTASLKIRKDCELIYLIHETCGESISVANNSFPACCTCATYKLGLGALPACLQGFAGTASFAATTVPLPIKT